MKYISIIMLFIASGCAVHINENSFFSANDYKVISQSKVMQELSYLCPSYNVESVSLQTEDGVTLRGVWLKGQSSALVSYYAGSSMSVQNSYKDVIPHFCTSGVDLVWFDYRGTGWSKGKSSLGYFLSDSEKVVDFIHSSSKKKVILHGFSLGTFIAGHLAASKQVDGLLFQAAATNINDWVEEAVPWYIKLSSTIVVDNKLNAVSNDLVVKKYSGPIALVVSKEDKVTPPCFSMILFNESVSSNKGIYISQEGGHGDSIKHKGAQFFMKKFYFSL